MLLLVSILIASCSASKEKLAKPSLVYSFEAAVNDASTSYPIVRVVVFDSANGDIQIRCVTALALLNAIEIEHGLKSSYDGPGNARQIALSSPGQLFAFKNQAALDTLTVPWLDKTQSEIACKAIESGQPAIIGDYAPYLYIGNGKGGLTKVD